MRVVGRTLPAQQWKVARELRRRIALALREMDVAVHPTIADRLAVDRTTTADPTD